MFSENNVQVRRVGKEASPVLTAIHEACFPNYWNISAFNDFFSVPGTVAWLAEIGTDAVGMAVHRVQFEQADILTLCVSPAYRRRGVAVALLGVVLDAIRAAGAQKLFLEVENGNDPALRLYERYGFAVIDRRRNYYRQKDGSCTDALVMRAKLD